MCSEGNIFAIPDPSTARAYIFAQLGKNLYRRMISVEQPKQTHFGTLLTHARFQEHKVSIREPSHA